MLTITYGPRSRTSITRVSGPTPCDRLRIRARAVARSSSSRYVRLVSPQVTAVASGCSRTRSSNRWCTMVPAGRAESSYERRMLIFLGEGANGSRTSQEPSAGKYDCLPPARRMSTVQQWKLPPKW